MLWPVGMPLVRPLWALDPVISRAIPLEASALALHLLLSPLPVHRSLRRFGIHLVLARRAARLVILLATLGGHPMVWPLSIHLVSAVPLSSVRSHLVMARAFRPVLSHMPVCLVLSCLPLHPILSRLSMHLVLSLVPILPVLPSLSIRPVLSLVPICPMVLCPPLGLVVLRVARHRAICIELIHRALRLIISLGVISLAVLHLTVPLHPGLSLVSPLAVPLEPPLL